MDSVISSKKGLALAILPLTVLACWCTTAADSIASDLRATPVSGYIFDLPANQGWSNTGVYLRAGQVFDVAYLAGQISDGASAIANAAGSGYVCGHSGCCEPLPKAPRGALIGRLGRDTFYIGNGGTFTAAESALLYLRVNDCDEGLYDNRGSLQIILLPR